MSKYLFRSGITLKLSAWILSSFNNTRCHTQSGLRNGDSLVFFSRLVKECHGKTVQYIFGNCDWRSSMSITNDCESVALLWDDVCNSGETTGATSFGTRWAPCRNAIGRLHREVGERATESDQDRPRQTSMCMPGEGSRHFESQWTTDPASRLL